MGLTEHTQGPWFVREHEGYRRIFAGASYLATVYSSPLLPEYESEAEANAQLIAAIPDILEALRTLVAQCESMGRASHTNDAIDAAHAAMTKAGVLRGL